MATPDLRMPQPAPAGSSRSIFTWSVTLAACAYIAWIGITLYRSTGAFANMFASLGAALPATTGFVFQNYQWFYPGLFGGAVGLVIVKQFFVRDRWKSVALTFAIVVLMDFAANDIIQALYRPLFDTIEKLNK